MVMVAVMLKVMEVVMVTTDIYKSQILCILNYNVTVTADSNELAL